MRAKEPGTRIWICDECGKRETWRKGWRCFPGVESDANKCRALDGSELLLPFAVCSDACEDRTLEKWSQIRLNDKEYP